MSVALYPTTILHHLVIAVTLLATISESTDHSKCGRSNAMHKYINAKFVTGGSPVEPNEWPWVVSIRARRPGSRGFRHYCAGALISPRFVLTAAHCVKKHRSTIPRELRSVRNVNVALGVHSLQKPGNHEFKIGVKRLLMHPRYETPGVRTWAHDLALLELKLPSYKPEHARAVCLPPRSKVPPPGSRCITVGWGKTETASRSYELRQVVLPIQDLKKCNDLKNWNGYVQNGTMLCAGKTQSTGDAKSACQGDSGGPMVCLEPGSDPTDDRFVVYGVVSWGPYVCGEKLSIYADVAHAADWIRKVLDEAGEKIDSLIEAPVTLTTPRWGQLQTRRVNLRTTTRAANITHPAPPCDATLFKRLPHTRLLTPPSLSSDSDVEWLSNKSVKDCLLECCRRGRDDCKSFQYYPRMMKCGLKPQWHCDPDVTTTKVGQPVIYFGYHCD